MVFSIANTTLRLLLLISDTEVDYIDVFYAKSITVPGL